MSAKKQNSSLEWASKRIAEIHYRTALCKHARQQVWKNILQNRFDLHQVSTESKAQVTYKAVITEGATETDTVIINIHFKLNSDKFSIAWDPRVRVIKT